MGKPLSKLKLHGFNNLTKSLSLSIYDLNYAQSVQHQKAYIEYIDTHYNTDRLTSILNDVCQIIGANVLNTARQEYDPQGASVTMLVAEDEAATADKLEESEKPGPLPNAIVSHLDKSHICVHTYPESHPVNGISTFRADIEISTCGVISPLKALNYLIHCFNLDIVTLDYRVRGFTRDVDGNKHYIDHQINSIQNYLATETCNKYEMIDVNIVQQNLFHTKLMIKEFDLANFILSPDLAEFCDKDKAKITEQLQSEMKEIFYGRNLA